MSGRIRAALIVCVLAVPATGVLAAVRHDVPRSAGRLILDDEFSGSSLDTAHWRTCYWWATTGCTNAGNQELEWYVPGQVQVGGGIVRLIAARRLTRGGNGHVYPFASGMISSGPSEQGPPRFAFRYGRVEARILVPSGPGLWSAFWMLPADRQDLPEIDAMETVGGTPDSVSMHVHYRGAGGKEIDMGSSWRYPSTAGGWHEFGIDWTPDRLEWLIDGKVRFHVTGAAVPHTAMYLLANLAVGGVVAGPPTASTSFPSALGIDWIRVWQ